MNTVTRREREVAEVQIGQYYRYVKQYPRKEHLQWFEGKLNVGELVCVTDISEHIDKITFYNGENGWNEKQTKFEEHFKFEPDGLRLRQEEVTSLQQENFQEQTEFSDIQQTLIGMTPHVESPGEVSLGNEEQSTELARRDNAPARAKAQLSTFMSLIKKKEASIKGRAERISALATEQEKAIKAKMEKMMALVKVAQEAIWTINLYLGKDEVVVQLATGKPAPAEEKITIRQLVLYMDEECAIASEEGGIDAWSMDKFDKWLLKSPKHLNQVLPDIKGVVAIKPRRESKQRSGDAWTQSIKDKANKKTYWLIRNGENIYRVATDFGVGDHIVPFEDEYLDMFKAAEQGKDTLRPGDAQYMEIMEAADSNKRDYMRILLILQGLIDRAVRTEDNKLKRLFHPLPDGADRINIMDERYHQNYVHYVYDAESKRLFGTGRPTFREWITDLNEKLEVGHRIICAWGGLQYGRYSEDEHRKERVRPNGARWPADMTIYTLEKKEGDALVFYYKRNEDVSKGSWYSEYGPAKNRASCRVYQDDGHVLNFDLATIEDMEFYLSSRTDRGNYVSMFPVLKRTIKAKRKEAADEVPFRKLLAGEIMKRFSVPVEKAEESVDELVYWYKFKNRNHRALTANDRKALDMIVGEFGLRQRKDAERSAMDHAPIVKAILQSQPDAIYIGHKVDNQYVALVPENDENVFVSELTYEARRSSVTLEDAKEWVGIDRRWMRWLKVHSTPRFETWEYNLRTEKYLTDPEIEQLKNHAIEYVRTNVTSVSDDDDEDLTDYWKKRNKEEKQKKSNAKFIAVTITDEQEIAAWVLDGRFKVPKHLLTGKWNTPDYVDIHCFSWTRSKDGFKPKEKPDRRNIQINTDKPNWLQKLKEKGQYTYIRNTRILWVDQDVQTWWEKNNKREEDANKRKNLLHKIVSEITDQVRPLMHEKSVAIKRAEYVAEYGNADLFEVEKGKIKWDEFEHWPENLHDAAEYLVERGIDVDGWSVGQIYAKAAEYGFKLDEKPRNTGRKGEVLPRDIDLLDDQTVIHIDMPKMLAGPVDEESNEDEDGEEVSDEEIESALTDD